MASLRRMIPLSGTGVPHIGYMGDYYAYLYMIKRGRGGRSDENVRDALNQLFYHVIGYVSRPFDVSPFIIFT